MHICIVVPSFNSGGAERIGVNLANELAVSGQRVTLVAIRSVGPIRSAVSQRVEVVELHAPRARLAALRLFRAFRQLRPTVVLSVLRDVNLLVGLVCWLLPGLRVVYREASTMHATASLPWFRRLPYMVVMRLAYRRADEIVANSQATRDDLEAHVAVAQKTCVIPNPVTPRNVESLFREGGDPLRDQLSKGTPVILAVGRLHPAKDHVTLLTAFAQLGRDGRKAKLVIIGDGNLGGPLQELAAQLNLQQDVTFIPHVDNPYPYYRAADVLVLSSRWEGFGNVLVEAMACGTPVVSTDCPGGPAGILGAGKYGKLTPVGDADALAEAIAGVLDGDRISSTVLMRRAQEFSIPAITKRYLDVLDDRR